METPGLLNRLIKYNLHIGHYERIHILLADCNSLLECKNDYWTYKQYAFMLEHAAAKLRRKCDKVKEDIKHGKR